MYAVIFHLTRTTHSEDFYQEYSEKMERLVKRVSGYINHHGQRDPISREGTSISYFESLESIKQWREHPEHLETQKLGKELFYEKYEVQVVKVERKYEWVK